MKHLNVYHRKDGRWEGRILKGKSTNGTRQYYYFLGKSREEVQQKMIEAYEDMNVNNGVDMTLKELFAEWFKAIHHKVKESTLANYRIKSEKHIIPFFGDKIADSLNQTEIYDFIDEKQRNNLSNRYITDMIILMKSVYKYGVRIYQMRNPMDGIELPKKKAPEIRILDCEEQKKLQRYLFKNQNHSTLGIAISMATGIRIGELCALQWKDIDIKKRIMTVRKTMQRIQCFDEMHKTKLVITEPKSDSSKRLIPIPEFIIEFLKKFAGKDDEFVVSGKTKAIEPRTVQYRFAKILKNVDLPSIHFHALRHIFASTCIKLGFDIKALSEILGHSSIEITLNRYVHSDFEQKVKYMNRLKIAI